MVKKTTLNELGEMVAHIVQYMSTLATKEDISTLRSELKGDIVGLGTQVNSLESQIREMKYTKMQARVMDLEEKVFGESRS